MTYLTLLATVLSFAITASGKEHCRLQVRIVDPFGIEIRKGYFSNIGQEERFETGKDNIVPCGELTLSFVALGFRTERVTVATRPGLQLRTIGMRPAPIEDVRDLGELTAIEIANFERFRGCYWLRIMPVFRPHAVYESLVSHRGGAGVPTLDPGIYSIVLIDKTGVCGSAFTATDGRSLLRVSLEPFVR